MTVELSVAVRGEPAEALVAELADLGFDAFQEDDGGLRAWGPAAAWSAQTRDWLGRWLGTRAPGARYAVAELPDRNWNEAWEASIEPVEAGPFLILPTWSAVPRAYAGHIPLRIDPKMSFGTGHHPSTRLALRLLSRHVAAGDRVLDVGTGTGVLALGALKLGAAAAIGCDIDAWSVPNARECASLNGLESQFEVREGGVDVVGETGFDLVLANIIRSVLVPMLPELRHRARPGGAIVLAGLLSTEREDVRAATGEAGLALVEEAHEGEWWACAFRRH